MTTVTIANRDNATFTVKGRKPLLDELRDQGVDHPMVASMVAVLLVPRNSFPVRWISARRSHSITGRSMTVMLSSVLLGQNQIVLLKLVWKVMTGSTAILFLIHLNHMS